MDTKKLFFFAAGLFFFLAAGYAAAVDLNEIEKLLNNKKYSIVLEKSLNILNTRGSQLSPLEAGSLNYFIGAAYKNNNNSEMAVTYLKKMESQFPTSKYLPNAYMELADIYKDDYFQREAFLEKVFENFPKTPEAIKAGTELSKGYLRLKNFQKALPVLETLVNMWKVAEENPELYMLLALAYSGINDYLEAIDYVRIAEKKIKKVIDSNPLYVFEAGKICYSNQNFKRSIEYLNRLINVYPTYKDVDEASILLSQAYEREKNLFMSAIYLIKAIEKNPPTPRKKYNLLLNLGRVLGLLDVVDLVKIEKAYPLYSNPQKILTTVKKNSPVFEQKRNAVILLSGEYKKSNDLEGVIDNYYKFLRQKRDPLVEKYFKENLDIYISDLHRHKDYDKVFKFWVIIKARKSYLSPANLLKLGEILVEMQLYNNAEEVYNHLLRYRLFTKQWPAARRQMARIHYKMGRYEQYLEVHRKLDLDSAKEPGKSEFLYYSLMVHREQKKIKELQDSLDTITYQAVSNDFQFKVLEIKADYLVTDEEYPDALELYNNLAGYPKISNSQRSGLLLKIADLYYKSENWESSLTYYDRADKLQKKQKDKIETEKKEWILYRKCLLLRKTDRANEASVTLKLLKEMNPTSFWVQQLEKESNVR